MTPEDKELIAKVREFIPDGYGHNSEYAKTLEACAAAIERLSAEVDSSAKDFNAARDAADHWFEQCETMKSELATLRAQLEAAQKQEPVCRVEKSNLVTYPVLKFDSSYVAKIGDKLYLDPIPQADAKDAERYPGLLVQDVGFQNIDRKSIPYVLISFSADDWETRDRFSDAMKGKS